MQHPTQKDFERTLHRNEEKMRIAVCDDKKEDRNQIKSLLEMYHQTFEIKEYDDSTALCTDSSFLQTCKILFLDINMHGMSGLEAARQIKSEYPTIHIILVTAYMNYALDGYKVKASRFLLKDDLDQTFEECMDDILKEIQQEERVVTYDFVEGSAQLRVDDIIYIETNRHKNIFYTQSQTLSIYRKMDDLENELKNMGFVRVHKSFLINMKYIKKISSYRMTLTTGKEISREVNLAILCFREVVEVKGRYLKHRSGAFAVAGRDERGVQIEESAFIEKFMDGESEGRTHSEYSAEGVGSRTQMGDLAQEFESVTFFLERIFLGVGGSEYFKTVGLHFD